MLNREQRRAQLKQLGKKFTGIDVTKGTIEVPVKGCDEPLVLDAMNFDNIYHLAEMCDKFRNLEASYSDEYAAVKATTDEHDKMMALIRLYRSIIKDFAVHIDSVFGDGATVKIFGNNAPMPQTIVEFIEDIRPVASALVSTMGAEMSGIMSAPAGVAAEASMRLGNA